MFNIQGKLVFHPLQLTHTNAFMIGGGLAGANTVGTDGASLIKASGMNMIVVTANYRVNFFGFLAGKEILYANRKGRGDPSYASFNTGYHDQRSVDPSSAAAVCSRFSNIGLR